MATPALRAKRRKYVYVSSMQIGAVTAEEPAGRSSDFESDAVPTFHGSLPLTTAAPADSVQFAEPFSRERSAPP